MSLKLKPTTLKDVDNIMTWVNDPEVVKNLQHFNKKFTAKDEVVYVKNLLASKNDFSFSIFDGKTYVGQCGIHQISWENKLGRLSLVIKKEFWNKGHGKKVLKLMIKLAFHKLKLHKIWLMHWKENKKSGHLYKKVGFQKEGVLKDEYFWRGKYHDMVRMAIVNRAK